MFGDTLQPSDIRGYIYKLVFHEDHKELEMITNYKYWERNSIYKRHMKMWEERREEW